MREKMSKQPPPAPTASATGPCPTIIQISRTPRHWKFIQHLSTTRPPPGEKGQRRVKKSKQPPPPRTYCECSRPLPYCIQIVRRPGTGSLLSTFAPHDHPHINIISSKESEAIHYKLARPSQQLFGIRLTTRLGSL